MHPAASLSLRSVPALLFPTAWSKDSYFINNPYSSSLFDGGGMASEDTWKQILLSLQSQWASAINSHWRVFPGGMPIADTEGSPKPPPRRTLALPSDGGIAHCHQPQVKICQCQSQVSLPSPLQSFSWKVSVITCTGGFRAEPALQFPEIRPCPCPCVSETSI